MARKPKIRFEWDCDREGLLWAIKDKGKITYDELMEAINAGGTGDAMQGRIFTIMFLVDRDKLAPTGWMDEDEPDGDAWQLWEVVDGETCPVCGKLSRHTYCPDCGKYVRPLDL